MGAVNLAFPAMEADRITDRLNRLRVTAALNGLSVTPSTAVLSPTNFGGLMVVETATLRIIAGRHFSLSLDEAEDVVLDLVAVPVPYEDA
ncbi:hypothetical protein [Methylobacterium sp. B1]|uniref:hypothetical protein n=1 Tax=Methylobacterium sp. B1 TaxID=91459 RepID=UPI00034A0A98|nr:hypothetical protein [Methylobacterium sp. B1]